MAHTTLELDRSRTLLDAVLAERDRCQDRYESSMGTSCEMLAYLRVRRARERVREYQRELDKPVFVS
jgi:hypothetical protein